MNKTIPTLTIAAIVGSSFVCNQSPSLEEQAGDKMNQIIRTQNAVGLSVAVVKDGKLIYAESFGFKNLEDSTLICTDDLFRIASVSKSFTATAIMQLHEQGKFNLDDDVGDAFGTVVRNPNHPNIPITYRMLLSHRSSLNDAAGYFSFDVIDPQKNSGYGQAYNSYAPGTQYEYCNLGYNMLGALIEIHSGERFDHYMDHHILRPLKINGGFNVDELDVEQFVTLYAFRDGVPVASPEAYRSRATEIEHYTMGRSAIIFSPTGGMKIAPKDLAKHLLVQMNGGSYGDVRILTPQSVALMQTPYLNQSTAPIVPPTVVSDTSSGLLEGDHYGFAMGVTDKLIQGETLVGHTGSSYGLYSAMFLNPEQKYGFIMMTNGYPLQRDHDGLITIQVDVMRALYEIFIRK